MLINSSFTIKILLSTITIFFCLFLMLKGYESLNIYAYKNDIVNKKDKLHNELKKDIKNTNTKSLILNKSEDKNLIQEERIVITIKKNDTFSKVIDQYFENKEIKNNVINKLNTEYNLKNLKIGQKIYLHRNLDKIVDKITIPYDFKTDIIIRIHNKKTELEKLQLIIEKEIESKKFIIESSIYKDGLTHDVPIKILSDIIKLYSFDVDFQRDIRVNDKLEFSYEILYNKDRDLISYGELKYASLKLQQSNLDYFVFKTDEGYKDYFDIKGKNVKKALMKTPIDGAKLSSSYGMRKHPISGYNKMHKGVDFAAPKGTPVYAAGNGIVEFVGRNGGYGKYIRLRHNNSYKTAYAHLNNYRKGLHKGLRVNQGDIIGYVGSTGRSTGPHLHYEIIYDGNQINPMKMKLPPRKILKGEELTRFDITRKKIYSDFLFNLYE